MLRMNGFTAIEHIIPVWISETLNWLGSQGQGSTGDEAHLNRFVELFLLSVERRDPQLLAPALQAWLESRPREEKGTFLPVLNKLLDLLLRTAQNELGVDETIAILNLTLPVFAFGNEYISIEEREWHVTHVSQELEQARQDLEHLDKSKSDFISIAAHELKTPLTLIEGYADMLRDLQISGSDQDPYRLMLQGIRTGTLRLREIIEDMIDVSLIDNQMLSLNYQPVWLNRLFKILEADFWHILEARQLTLDIRTFPGSEEMTFADPERLLQAFRNLLTNAIKYTPDGGRITIDGQKLPGFIEVSMKDTGIGIDPQDHSRVFEKFGHLGNSALHSSGKTKFKGGGPGLGLPISKGILEAHGGAIWVESMGYDEVRFPGTTFRMLIPLRSEPPDEKIARLFRTALESGQLVPPDGYVAKQEVSAGRKPV